MAGIGITVQLDERDLQKVRDRLVKYEGATFKKRMEAAYLAGARLLVKPMRSRAPRRSGLLASKVSTRKRSPSVGDFVQVGTKSRAPHAGLVAQGHRIVTHSGRDTGRRSRPDPFVVDTIQGYESQVIKFIEDATIDDGVTVFGGGR